MIISEIIQDNQAWAYFQGENVLNSDLFEGHSKRYNTKLRSILMDKNTLWILRRKIKPENE
jgi:hypothetical protein